MFSCHHDAMAFACVKLIFDPFNISREKVQQRYMTILEPRADGSSAARNVGRIVYLNKIDILQALNTAIAVM
jgi:hypothetical protein